MKNVKPKKKYGQNFLSDKNTLNKIANAIDINNKNIIEIGPGLGTLTEHLLNKANKVIAFEIDSSLINNLKNKFIDKNFEIINQDFLDANLSLFNDYVIIANIPYNISTDILFKIFENSNNFSDVVLLVQKEFALRVCAKVNSSDYSKLAPTTKLFYESRICFDVDKKMFWPQPKVTSSLIHLTRSKINYDVDYKEMMNFIKECFLMRRKTLKNNLKKSLSISNDQFELICNELNLNMNIRPEELSLNQFIDIYKKIKSN